MSPTKQLPETSLEAVQLGQWREWLMQPVTRAFFAQLRLDRDSMLRKAAKAAVTNGTGPANARQHNNLILAEAINQVIDKYDNGTKYPITVKLSEAGSIRAAD